MTTEDDFQAALDGQPELKPSALVYNERFRRWGQVLKPPKEMQWATGHPDDVLVWDTSLRGQTTWAVADLSMVVVKGKIVWQNPALATELDRGWREAEGRI